MRLGLVCWLVSCFGFALSPLRLAAENPQELPSFAQIRVLVDQHFADQPSLRAGHVICQNEASSLFSTLAASGWIVEDGDEILKRMLAANDPLIGILRSPNGTKFIQQVANEKLIYDRLDRIAREPGGQRLLTDLVKLPNAASLAKQTTPRGVPDLVDLLPKDRSGKTRRVKDYDKATEKIYTIADLEKALQKSYDAARQKVRS